MKFYKTVKVGDLVRLPRYKCNTPEGRLVRKFPNGTCTVKVNGSIWYNIPLKDLRKPRKSFVVWIKTNIFGQK